MRRFFLEAGALVAAAVVCALVSNALAARERKMALVGFYPNAQKVPVATSPATTSAPAPVTPSVSEGPGRTGGAPPAPPGPSLPLGVTKAPATAPAPAPVPAPAPGLSSPPVPAPPPAQPKKPDLARFAAHPDKPYTEIKYDDVAALHEGGVLFLDARRTSVYEQGHIAGARPFSVWESDIDDKVRKLFDERGDPAEQLKPIVVYCSGGDCEDSHMLAQKLWGAQFNNVYVYKDGYPDWVAHRGAVHTGTNP